MKTAGLVKTQMESAENSVYILMDSNEKCILLARYDVNLWSNSETHAHVTV